MFTNTQKLEHIYSAIIHEIEIANDLNRKQIIEDVTKDDSVLVDAKLMLNVIAQTRQTLLDQIAAYGLDFKDDLTNMFFDRGSTASKLAGSIERLFTEGDFADDFIQSFIEAEINKMANETNIRINSETIKLYIFFMLERNNSTDQIMSELRTEIGLE